MLMTTLRTMQPSLCVIQAHENNHMRMFEQRFIGFLYVRSHLSYKKRPGRNVPAVQLWLETPRYQ